MKNKRNLIFLLLLAGFFAAGYGVSRIWLGLPDPKLAAVDSMIGENGPVGLIFSQSMQPASVESRWTIQPGVKGRFEWGGDTSLWFFPEEPLKAGKTYQVSLAAGAQSSDGRAIKLANTWQISIRAPQILFLSPTGETSDLWVRSTNLADPHQLTSGKGTYDFAVSMDGAQIAYSQANDLKGLDLWMMQRDGTNQHKLVDCGVGRCTNPAWSPDGRKIAYSRMDAVISQLPGSTNAPNDQNNTSGPTSLSASRIWTVDNVSGQTLPYYTDLHITGTAPTWSPDGRWLAFVDTGEVGIRMINLVTRADNVLPANTPVLGSWALDGSRLLYVDLDTTELPSLGEAYQISLPSLLITGFFSKGPDYSDYSLPALAPDGTWVAVGLRFQDSSSARQLWLLSPDGSKHQVISGDNVITHGAYSWSPDGSSLVYQQVALDSSSAKPDVMMWNLGSGAATLIAKDAFHPQWLP